MILQCSLGVLVPIHTHSLPILAKYHHMPLYYNYDDVRDIYYFGQLQCRFVCTYINVLLHILL